AWMYHAHLAAVIGSMLQRSRIPVIWNVRHSIDKLAQEKPAMRLIVRLAALMSRWPRMIIYNSHAAAQQHHRLGFRATRTMVIPNGFDCNLFQPRQDARNTLVASLGIDPATLIIGMAARNHPMKDAATLVESVIKARNEGIDIHLLLMGEGMDEPSGRLKRLIEDMPTDRLTLQGHVRPLAELLPGLDLLVLPSAWGEGFPNILGEAMSCGVPCIATDVGDSRWIMQDGGIVVSPRDSDQMASAIATMAKLGVEGRRKLGMAARQRVEDEFSMDRIGTLYTQLYQEVGDALQTGRSPSHPEIRQAQVM
ncbi:MAG TPA: glycosyltransferase, partial [Sphingobium sp.]